MQKIAMGIPPPKLRNLAEWSEENADRDRNEVREVHVPARKSLSWSVVLSVLLSKGKESFPDLVKKLTGGPSELDRIRKIKPVSEINPIIIEKRMRSFNPFKNRHNFSHWKELKDLVLILDYRLNRNSPRSTHSSKDDSKLKTASKLLDCKIEVYFPETKEFVSYPDESRAFTRNIVLFQYAYQQYGARRDPINIFSFGMELSHEQVLKLKALRHFLKKAKIENSDVETLVNIPEIQGDAFLPAIIENGCSDILVKIYRSPYIALRLSEAGFETDPMVRMSDKPSPLCCALLWSTDPVHLRILYDYASNCRSLFDKSVRRADGTVLENLKRIKSVIETDISLVNASDFETDRKRRAIHILKQLYRFIEYQSDTATDLTSLRNKLKNKEMETLHYRKEIIRAITKHYLSFFHYEGNPPDVAEQLNDFVSFEEYYSFIDNFFYLSFFDNFFKLKLMFGLNEDHVLSSDIEGKTLLAIFSRCIPENTAVERNDIYKEISLHYRKVVKTEMESLFRMLNDSNDSELEKKFAVSCYSFPQVIDELIMSRLDKYLRAVKEISPSSDGMKAVLVIERALQVIGESIKAPRCRGSSRDSIVSFLLRSCLPVKLQNELMRIRNDLSKFRSNLAFGRYKIETNPEFFEEIKGELEKIQDAFESVKFAQCSRLEELMMSDGQLNHLPGKVESVALQEYEKYHKRCVELLLDSLSDLREHSNFKPRDPLLHMQQLLGQLKSIEYLLKFIVKKKSEEYLNSLLNEVTNKIDKVKSELEKSENITDQIKETESKVKNLNKSQKNEIQKLKEVIKGQLNSLQQDLNIFLPQCEDEILRRNCKKDDLLLSPRIESFMKHLKEDMFSDEEKSDINAAAQAALQEVGETKRCLKDIFEEDFKSESIPKVDEMLKKILTRDKSAKLATYYENKMSKEALKYLERYIKKEDEITADVKKILDQGFLMDGYATTVLTKIAFQRQSSATRHQLPDGTCQKLKHFLTKKIHFLLERLSILKQILLEEEKEIQATWQWGRSEPIKYHLEFLICQRYIREKSVCSALEMAYFDCVNVFHQPLKDRDREQLEDPDDSLASVYEKPTDLFSGFDLRHLVSHRNNVADVIGGFLDEDDVPSAMIRHMMELINDTDAIHSMLQLFEKAAVLEQETFVEGVKNSNFQADYSELIEKIKRCDRWEDYIPLFPFLKL